MNRTDRNKLVTENLPLVGYLVSDLCARASHLSRDGLASLGIPFGAYARNRIVGAFARAGHHALRGLLARLAPHAAAAGVARLGLDYVHACTAS